MSKDLRAIVLVNPAPRASSAVATPPVNKGWGRTREGLNLISVNRLGEHKEALIAAMQEQTDRLTKTQRDAIPAMIRDLDEHFDFNARALFHLLDKLAYALPQHLDDIAHMMDVIYHDGLRLITSSTMNEAGEAERMADEISRDLQAQRVLAFTVIDTPLSDFFEKMVTVSHRIKEIVSEREVDETTQKTAATEAAARQRWMYIAGTFLFSLRLSDLREADQMAINQLFERPGSPAAH